MPADERQAVLQDALEAAKQIEFREYGAPALAAVVAQIPASEIQLLQDALDAAKQIKYEKYRSQEIERES